MPSACMFSPLYLIKCCHAPSKRALDCFALISAYWWKRDTFLKQASHSTQSGHVFTGFFFFFLTLFTLYTQQVNSEPRFWKINLRGQMVFLQWGWDKKRCLAAETQPVWQVYCSKCFLQSNVRGSLAANTSTSFQITAQFVRKEEF